MGSGGWKLPILRPRLQSGSDGAGKSSGFGSGSRCRSTAARSPPSWSGALVLLGVVFVLGLEVGQRLGTRRAEATRPASLADLDGRRRPASPRRGKDLTFPAELPRAKPAPPPPPRTAQAAAPTDGLAASPPSATPAPGPQSPLTAPPPARRLRAAAGPSSSAPPSAARRRRPWRARSRGSVRASRRRTSQARGTSSACAWAIRDQGGGGEVPGPTWSARPASPRCWSRRRADERALARTQPCRTASARCSRPARAVLARPGNRCSLPHVSSPPSHTE